MGILLSLVIALIILGAVLYIVNILPIDDRIKQVIFVIMVVAIAIYCIQILLGVTPMRLTFI